MLEVTADVGDVPRENIRVDHDGRCLYLSVKKDESRDFSDAYARRIERQSGSASRTLFVGPGFECAAPRPTPLRVARARARP